MKIFSCEDVCQPLRRNLLSRRVGYMLPSLLTRLTLFPFRCWQVAETVKDSYAVLR